jgi:4-hydroxybenzoate polyprenyltransferase
MATDAPVLPFPTRLKLYLDERFPLTTHLVVVCAFFLSNFLLAERLSHPGAAHFGWRAVAGMAAVLLTFFLLRVFDEFKDYARDVIAHPDRVVSRGIMPLSELKVMGWTVAGALLLLNLPMGVPTIASYLLVITYALLMYREFFVGEWLNKHIVLYALTHQVITPLLCVYVFMLSATQVGAGWSALFWLQLGMGAGTGLGWEMARKVRMPEDEQPMADTYSKHFGPALAALMAFSSLVFGALCALALGLSVGFGPIAYGLLGLGMLVTAFGFVKFWLKPSAKGAKGLDNWAAVLMLLCYVAIAVGGAAGRGISFTF